MSHSVSSGQVVAGDAEHANSAQAELRHSELRSQGWPRLWWSLLLVVLTVLVFGRTVEFEFVNFDDNVHVYENDFVTRGLTASGLWWNFGIHGPSQWHPLAWFSHQLDWLLYGDNASGHHLSNVVLHSCSVLLLFFAMQSLLGRVHAAGLMAMIFAIHPLNVESVAWVSERRNVLCGVFWMATLLAYHRYAERGGFVRWCWVTLWIVLALMSKPLAVTLPCVLLLLDYWPLQRLRLNNARNPQSLSGDANDSGHSRISMLLIEKLPWFALSAAASWLSYLCQQKISVVSDLGTVSGVVRLQNACVSYALYLRRMLWPMDLAVFYPHPAWTRLDAQDYLLVPAIVSGIALLLITSLVFRRLLSSPGLAVGWFWFLGTLVPMIGLVQVGRQQLADRYMYLPMIGLSLMAISLPCSVRQQRVMFRIMAGLVVFWTMTSAWQVGYWRDSETLFTRAIQVTERNSWAHLNLGLALQNQGNSTTAIQHYQLALQIDPQYVLAHYNSGVVWHDAGRLDLAISHFRRAVELDISCINAWIRLGGIMGQTGKWDAAESCFRQALTQDPDSAQARFNLGIVLQQRGDQAAALVEMQGSVQQQPHNLHFRSGWMQALVQAGYLPEAREQAQELIRQDPHHQDAVRLLQSKGASP